MAVKIHYCAEAKPSTSWRDADALHAASPQTVACGHRGRGNHSGGLILATSTPEIVDCKRCRATLDA